MVRCVKMKQLSFLVLAVCLNFSIALQCPFHSKRISEMKCQQYKDIVAKNESYGGGLISPPKVVKTYDCGNKCFTGFIVGGVTTYAGEFPHMAALGWQGRDGLEFRCGGSLISEKYILTAAHCMDEGIRPSIVRLGEQNLATNNDGASPDEYKVKNVIIHPNYSKEGDKQNDIALIELEKEVAIKKDFIRPACLQQQEENFNDVIATGWGRTSWMHDETSDELRKASLRVRDISICEDKLKLPNLYSSQMCAGGNNDTCQGDSGGPIQVSHIDACCVYKVVGITSYGSRYCGSTAPAIYTKVSQFLDWIERIVWPCPKRRSGKASRSIY